jgi:hypothetical protein
MKNNKLRAKVQPVIKTWRDRIAKRWRGCPDEILFAVSPPPSNGAESLHPGEDTIIAYLSGSERAAAIMNAWAFNHPITSENVR